VDGDGIEDRLQFSAANTGHRQGAKRRAEVAVHNQLRHIDTRLAPGHVTFVLVEPQIGNATERQFTSSALLLLNLPVSLIPIREGIEFLLTRIGTLRHQCG
jgi:hypothetical protein